MTIHIHIAKDEKTKERIFNFRYQIHSMGLGHDATHIDHDNQWIRDEHDENAELIYAEKNNQIIGTLRIHINQNGLLPKKLAADLKSDRIEKVFGKSRVAYTSYFLLDPRVRGKTVASLLMHSQFQYILKCGILIHLILCEAPLTKMYLRLGYRHFHAHAHSKVVHQKTLIPLLLCARDHHHLTTVMSPFVEHLDIKRDDRGNAFKLIAEMENISAREHKIELSDNLSDNLLDISTFWAEFADGHAREVLRRQSLFDGLKAHEIFFVLQENIPVQIAKNTIAQAPKEHRAKAGIVLSGKLGEGIFHNDSYHWMGIFREGDSFSDPVFDKKRDTQAELIALEACEVIYLSVDFFERIKQLQPLLATRLTMNLISLLQQRFNFLEEAIDIAISGEEYVLNL